MKDKVIKPITASIFAGAGIKINEPDYGYHFKSLALTSRRAYETERVFTNNTGFSAFEDNYVPAYTLGELLSILPSALEVGSTSRGIEISYDPDLYKCFFCSYHTFRIKGSGESIIQAVADFIININEEGLLPIKKQSV